MAIRYRIRASLLHDDTVRRYFTAKRLHRVMRKVQSRKLNGNLGFPEIAISLPWSKNITYCLCMLQFCERALQRYLMHSLTVDGSRRELRRLCDPREILVGAAKDHLESGWCRLCQAQQATASADIAGTCRASGLERLGYKQRLSAKATKNKAWFKRKSNSPCGARTCTGLSFACHEKALLFQCWASFMLIRRPAVFRRFFDGFAYAETK